MHTDKERVMALAGLYQAAHLTQQIAHRGMADTHAMTASIGSLFKLDADDVEDVYGGAAGVLDGARLLHDQLAGAHSPDIELSRYVVALTRLERKLSRNRAMLDQIARGITEATRRLEHFSLLHPNILSQLAEIYKQSISRLQPRIMVKGEPLHLNNPENASKIRALLLAGIRSAMLWRQLGGARRQIVLQRRRLIDSSSELIRET